MKMFFFDVSFSFLVQKEEQSQAENRGESKDKFKGFFKARLSVLEELLVEIIKGRKMTTMINSFQNLVVSLT